MKALKFLIAAATTADGRVMRLTPDAGWNSGAVTLLEHPVPAKAGIEVFAPLKRALSN